MCSRTILCTWAGDKDSNGLPEAVTIAVNEKISEAFIRLGDPRFHFVDALVQGGPFTGHDLCGGSSYFNNWNPTKPEVFTAHPNTAGQDAYGNLIRSYLLNIG